jgi:tRNA threonylcarbamoyladenosine biosynthesis protein TsaB
MKILAMDASTSVLSCALVWDEGSASRSAEPGPTYAERLMPMIEALFHETGMKPGDIGLIACGAGPGSFTGLRIALSTAKGIQAGTGAPIVLVPTLDFLAHGFQGSGVLVPVIDARKGRLYAAIYRSGRREGPWLDLSAQDLAARLMIEEEATFTGPDAELMAQIVLERPGWGIDPDHARPRPESLAKIGLRLYHEEGGAPPAAAPLYVRNEDADIGIT